MTSQYLSRQPPRQQASLAPVLTVPATTTPLEPSVFARSFDPQWLKLVKIKKQQVRRLPLDIAPTHVFRKSHKGEPVGWWVAFNPNLREFTEKYQ